MTETGLDVAIRLGFHAMTREDASKAGRALLETFPARSFEELEAGKTYCLKRSYEDMQSVAVHKLTPKHAWITASINDEPPRRYCKGNMYGHYFELVPDCAAVSRLTHEDMVKHAVRRGIDVPPLVRRQYPHLFLNDVPERFGVKSQTAIERLRGALSQRGINRKYMGRHDVIAWINEAHDDISVWRDKHICEAEKKNRYHTDKDYDRLILGYWHDIDFYRWLLPHVSEGGVFFVPSTKGNTG
jgi:hypothetical protein